MYGVQVEGYLAHMKNTAMSVELLKQTGIGVAVKRVTKWGKATPVCAQAAKTAECDAHFRRMPNPPCMPELTIFLAMSTRHMSSGESSVPSCPCCIRINLLPVVLPKQAWMRAHADPGGSPGMQGVSGEVVMAGAGTISRKSGCLRRALCEQWLSSAKRQPSQEGGEAGMQPPAPSHPK